MMSRESRPFQQFDWSFGIAKTELQREVHIVCRLLLEKKKIEGGIVVWPHEAIDDAAREIRANCGFESICFDQRLIGIDRFACRRRLAHDFDEISGRSVAEAETGKTQRVAALLSASFAGMHAEAFHAEFNQDRFIARPVVQ